MYKTESRKHFPIVWSALKDNSFYLAYVQHTPIYPIPFPACLAKLVLPYAINVSRGPEICCLCWGHMILEWGTLTTLETTCTNYLSSAEEACVFWQSFYLFESWFFPEDYAILPVTLMYFFVSITDIYVPVHHFPAVIEACVRGYKLR